MQKLKKWQRSLSVVLYLAIATIAACTKAPQSPTPSVTQEPAKTPEERQRLFEQLGIEYTATLQFSEECKELAKLTPQDYSEYQGNEKKYDALNAQYGANIAQGYVAPVSIRYISKKVGRGVFAEVDFEEGDFLMEYTGKVVKKASSSTWTWTYPPGSDNKLKGTSASLDAGPYGNEARFVNHSDNPNTKMEFVFQGGAWHVIYVVAPGKKISKGKQICTSYGEGYWKSREKVAL